MFQKNSNDYIDIFTNRIFFSFLFLNAIIFLLVHILELKINTDSTLLVLVTTTVMSLFFLIQTKQSLSRSFVYKYFSYLFFSIFILGQLIPSIISNYVMDNFLISRLHQMSPVFYLLGLISIFMTLYNQSKYIDELSPDSKNTLQAKDLNLSEPINIKSTNKNSQLARIFIFFIQNKYIYVVGLFMIVIFGFILRVYNVGTIDLVNDEYRHLNPVMHFYESGSFDQPRGVFVTIIGIIVKYFVSYDNYFAFKLPFVLFGTLSIIGIFFLANEYTKNKNIAILSAYLYAILPLAIGLSRYIREYEILMLLFIITLYFSKKKDSIKFDFFILISWFFLYKLIGLTGVLICGFLAINLFIKITWSIIKTKYPFFCTKQSLLKIFLTIIGFIIPIMFATFHFFYNPGFLFIFNFTPFPNQFEPHPTGYTWFPENLNSMYILTLVFAYIILLFSDYEKNKKGKVELLLIFVTTVFYFVFVAKIQFIWQPRYIYYVFPIFIIILSNAVVSILDILEKGSLYTKYTKVIIYVLIIIFIFSPLNAIKSLKTERPGYNNPLYGQPVYADKELCNYLKINNISASKILVSNSWSLDYCYKLEFLNENGKQKYLDITPEEFYDSYDRTSIYISSTWNEKNVQQTVKRIRDNQLEYLILSSRIDTDRRYLIDLLLENDLSFELIKVLPNDDAPLKYQIYKIIY